MLAIEDVIQWLRDGEDWGAAEILAECDFKHEEVVDWERRMEIEMEGYEYRETYILKIEAPRRILKGISGDLKSVQGTIEGAINECTQTHDVDIQGIRWVPKLGNNTASPSDPETEAVLATVDSNHVKTAWAKAINRRQVDPDGAITAAKTLVESVCKHILANSDVRYPPNPDITKLYYLVSEELRLSPNQHIHKQVKAVLGNCQAVVGGIAFIRNNLGDAHSREPGTPSATPADAELAVNLAGALATFLVRTWETQKNTEPEDGRIPSESALPDGPSF